jgi:predicted lipoprotein with Yx(FWY)xxD motif
MTKQKKQDRSWMDRMRAAAPPGDDGAVPDDDRRRARMRWLMPGGLVAAGLIVAASAISTSAPAGASTHSGLATVASASASSGTTLKTTKIHGVTVLTNAKGFTVYSFAPDNSTTSKCNGACAQAWPPVKGPAKAGPGVTGKLATLKRSDGSIQATYNGHPLYTFTADTAPGQANGNGSTAFGGVWKEITPTGKAAPTSTSSGGGYGY